MSKKSSFWFAVGMVVATAGYGLFEARSLMQGPVLHLRSPRPGETITDVLLHIEGTAANVTRVTLNGRPISLDLSGAFNETLLAPNGYGVILVEAENRFGKRVSERVEVVGKRDGADEQPLNTATGNS